MKLAFVFSFLFSVSALSCPDLKGQWNCQSSDGNSAEITIQQQDIPGGVLYKITNGESGDETIYHADGVPRPAEGEGMTGTETATCKADALLVKQQISNESMKFESSMDSEFKLISPTEMNGVTTRIYTFDGKPIQNATYETSCFKQ
jgi:hypothetical protein